MRGHFPNGREQTACELEILPSSLALILSLGGCFGQYLEKTMTIPLRHGERLAVQIPYLYIKGFTLHGGSHGKSRRVSEEIDEMNFSARAQFFQLICGGDVLK